MRAISTRQAAKKLGLHPATLAHYIEVGKLPAPTILDVGTRKLHGWTEEEIERARALLPKIANGRKMRHVRKKQSAVSTQQSAKSRSKAKKKQEPQPRAANVTYFAHLCFEPFCWDTPVGCTTPLVDICAV